MTADEASQMQKIESAKKKADVIRLAIVIDNLLSTIEGRDNIHLVVSEARKNASDLIGRLST